MKKRTRNLLIILLFCLSIFSVPVLFLLLPEQGFSPLEKRYLAEMPALNTGSITSGEFTEKLGTYVSDHFPGREFFVGLNAYYDLLSGRQETKEYLLSHDGRLYARPSEPVGNTMEANLSFINAFSRSLAGTGAEIPVTLMLVPSSGSVLLPGADYPDEALIAQAYTKAETAHVDLLGAFRSAPDPGSLYYRTDHHWTSAGAYLAACAYRRGLNLPYAAPEAYTVQRFEPFYGSAYSGSGLWLTKPDALELWHSGQVVQVTNETGESNDSVFYPERLSEQDRYQVFLDGNHALVRIENLSLSAEEGRSILVIRDSFSNSLGCFLSDLYSRVILVDLRYYKLPLTDLILSEDIDEILIEYSVDNFVHDTNLAFLEVDPEPIRAKVEEENRPPNYFAPPMELTDSFFDGAFFLGDSINGILANYCASANRLTETTISSNAMLSYHDVAKQLRRRLIYKGNYAVLPEVLGEIQPEILITAMGCNDLATYDFAHCQEMFIAYLDLVREIDPEITIFIQSVLPIRVNMTNFNQRVVDEFNAWLKEKAEVYDYCYIEVDGYLKGSDGQMNVNYRLNDTHINWYGAEVWLRELMNIENYHNFPKKYYVEYDGETNLPVENSTATQPAAEEEEQAPPEREATALDKVYEQIRLQTSCPEMLELNEKTVNSYLGLTGDEFTDGRFYLCANNLKADEIWLVELPDEAEAGRMAEVARERIAVKASSYDLYLPEESELARRGIVTTKGRYLALFISPEADQMQQIFLNGGIL